MLTTLLRPSAGTALVAGFDIVKEADQVRRSIGVALQDAAIDPLMTGNELLELQAVLYGIPRAKMKKRVVDSIWHCRSFTNRAFFFSMSPPPVSTR